MKTILILLLIGAMAAAIVNSMLRINQVDPDERWAWNMHHEGYLWMDKRGKIHGLSEFRGSGVAMKDSMYVDMYIKMRSGTFA